MPPIYRDLLLWVWVTTNFPRFDGLSDGAEVPKLSQIEDDLSASLGPLGAVFAGRITGDNRREFYYYLPASNNPKGAVLAAMKAHSDYTFTLGSKQDAVWEQYLDLLYPNDEQLQGIGNRDTLDAMRNQGDSLDLPRKVAHWIYFTKAADRDALSIEAIAAGYFVESLYDLGPGNQRAEICPVFV
jgi:hypothetical protein